MPTVVVPTPIGGVRAHADARGRLVALDFLKGPDGKRQTADLGFDSALRNRLQKALDAYFEKGRPFPRLPVGNTGGTPFQRRVWRALTRIPLGQTRTYGEVAASIGAPRAARAVGAACGANPLPLLVPCHRVLAAGGGLGGFSGGLSIKKKLLRVEGVVV